MLAFFAYRNLHFVLGVENCWMPTVLIINAFFVYSSARYLNMVHEVDCLIDGYFN